MNTSDQRARQLRWSGDSLCSFKSKVKSLPTYACFRSCGGDLDGSAPCSLLLTETATVYDQQVSMYLYIIAHILSDLVIASSGEMCVTTPVTRRQRSLRNYRPTRDMRSSYCCQQQCDAHVSEGIHSNSPTSLKRPVLQDNTHG